MSNSTSTRRTTSQLLQDHAPTWLHKWCLTPIRSTWRNFLPSLIQLLYQTVVGSSIPLFLISFVTVQMLKNALLTIPWVATTAAAINLWVSFKLALDISSFSCLVAPMVGVYLICDLAMSLIACMFNKDTPVLEINPDEALLLYYKNIYSIATGLFISGCVSLTGLPLILTPAFVVPCISSSIVNFTATILGSSFLRFIGSWNFVKLLSGAMLTGTCLGHIFSFFNKSETDPLIRQVYFDTESQTIKDSAYSPPSYTLGSNLILNMKNLFPDLLEGVIQVSDWLLSEGAKIPSIATSIPKAIRTGILWGSGNFPPTP